VLAVDSAQADLAAGRLRVLHERSFSDDPTRALRLARYAERLGFEVEPLTARLAAAARLDTVSGARIGAELRLAVAEPDPVAVLARVARQLPIDVERDVLEGALALAPPDADRAMLVLGAIAREPAWLDELELTARERDIALACARVRMPDRVAPPSALWRAWRTTPVEAVAVAGARWDPSSAREWIERLRHVTLEIGGDDLIAAGLLEGPEIGRRLERTLARKLDGELAGGREAELADALGAQP
jgi:tRNA nucleotidyltransferase (CCA-adding enzyme)